MSSPQPVTGSLFAGEIVDTVAGHPCLYKYSPSTSQSQDRPLVVFIPGGFHLARVFYGGHEGSRKEDFLAHWLNGAGFDVLAISYPLETQPELIMPAVCPGFRIGDWGRQAAEVTKRVVEAHQLPGKQIVLAAWSMGGRVVVPFTKAAEALGLRVELFVALAATPGLAGVLRGDIGSMVHCSKAGYAASPAFTKGFYAHVRAQGALNHKEIIPEATYVREYYGNTPISLLGYTLKHDREGGRFVDDGGLSIGDSEGSEFARFPWIATVCPDSEDDTRHALADKAAWGFIFTMKLAGMVEDAKSKGGPLGDSWERVAALVAAIPERLATRIEGNHFFFVGEQGARETAKAIASHWETLQILRSEVMSLLER
ncbi:thioesterase domain protein [Mycena galopus ATCC 62051]|nr:thioesterase domain protein [Mycena galopus ATCC 62051]